MDNAGHLYGHDPSILQYGHAVRQTGRNIDLLLKEIELRERSSDEEWLVLITTDHGGSSRWRLEQSDAGSDVLTIMDADPQINAGISQVHLEGVHGLQDDTAIGHEQTRTFIIMKHGNRAGHLGDGRTNRDITPTVLDYLSPNHDSLLDRLDGRSLLR